MSVNDLNPDNPETFPPHIRLQVRLWASRRQQTLYRTVTGFYKYYEALALNYRLEAADALAHLGEDEREREIERVVNDKFRLTVSMQRYAEFTPDEKECTKILMDICPKLVISYPGKMNCYSIIYMYRN
jgi:1,3-beta-glucan synthase